MIHAHRQRLSELGILDYVLSATGSALATYSAGMALSNAPLGLFFTGFVILGTFFSYFMSRVFRTPGAQLASGFLYAAALLIAFFLARRFNAMLPDGGFPWQLMVGGMLCWMLMFGSFFAWRDSTLLFQAVPSIALFGMVGTWDTFQGAVVAFFVFLLCLATLFARTHARLMLMQAKRSGYLGHRARDDAPSDADLDVMQRGPWRWMAGPEWALASAAAVVMVSLLGAPLLQESVRGVSEAVRIRVPLPPQMRAPRTVAAGGGLEATIGNGPIPLSDTPVIYARMDQPRYLRARTYDQFTGRGWRTTYYAQNNQPIEPERLAELARTLMRNPQTIRVELEIVGGLHSSLPAPGYVTSVDIGQLRHRTDGTIDIPGTATALPRVRVRTMVADDSVVPEKTEASLQRQRFLDSDFVRPAVVRFFEEAALEGQTDYERARLVKRAIERQTRYNINAPAVPAGSDPVEYFLFQSKEGYCDLFASAMVHGARTLGIPARYVTGYLPTPGDVDESGRFIVRSRDAHAWAELYFVGVGWVAFDATEGAEAVPGGERGATNESSLPLWVRAALWSLGGGVVLGVAYFLIRRIRIVRPVPGQREQVARLMSSFLASVETRARLPRLASQTSSEYIAGMNGQLGPAKPAALELDELLVVAMYARDEPDEARIAELRQRLREFRQTLKRTRAA
ncbi:MAG TPA: transglutaminase domain-containing protein [Fimbriimonadaceae bacterium]|nr:transglutaminase domain-containing protein [Fimbriimonadaceae bacterium]